MIDHLEYLLKFRDSVDFDEVMNNGVCVKEYLVDLTGRARPLMFPFQIENIQRRFSIPNDSFILFLKNFYLISRFRDNKPIILPYPTTSIQDSNSVLVIDYEGHGALPKPRVDEFILTSSVFDPEKDFSLEIMISLIEFRLKEPQSNEYSIKANILYHYIQTNDRRIFPDMRNQRYKTWIGNSLINKTITAFNQCAYYNLVFEHHEKARLN